MDEAPSGAALRRNASSNVSLNAAPTVASDSEEGRGGRERLLGAGAAAMAPSMPKCPQATLGPIIHCAKYAGICGLLVLTSVVSVFGALIGARVIEFPCLGSSCGATPPQPIVDDSENIGATLVLMSFKRPDAVRRIVSNYLAWPELVPKIIIWNANPDEDSLSDVVASDPERITLVSSTRDLGLHQRFAAAALSERPRVLVQDDDLMLPRHGLHRLLTAYKEQPDRIHGVFCRWPTREAPYSVYNTGPYSRCPIVLTKILVAPTFSVGEFFKWAPRFEKEQADARPRWNGEDILFSLATVARNNGTLNVVHPELEYEMQKMSEAWAISGRAKHSTFRPEFTKAVYGKLGLQLPDSYDLSVEEKAHLEEMKAKQQRAEEQGAGDEAARDEQEETQAESELINQQDQGPGVGLDQQDGSIAHASMPGSMEPLEGSSSEGSSASTPGQEGGDPGAAPQLGDLWDEIERGVKVQGADASVVGAMESSLRGADAAAQAKRPRGGGSVGNNAFFFAC